MIVRTLSGAVLVYAPAKVNLFLEVIAKLPDGFHEIETLMAPVALFDSLVFRSTDDGRITLASALMRSQTVSSLSGGGSLPPGDENIAVKAVELLRRRAGETRGGRLMLVKRIPIAAGLAGGSTDAAAALVAANIAWGLNWPNARLAMLAAELGSDVPFFLGRGPALCRGRGEKIERLANLPALHLVIASPSEGLSTASVYRTCRPAPSPCSASPMLAAWRRGEAKELGQLLHNRLEPAAAALCPAIDRLRREFARLGVCGSLMSGSGSSYFGLCRHARHARRVAAALRARGFTRAIATTTCG